MIPGNYDLPALTYGDTYYGAGPFQILETATQSPPTADLASVKMEFRNVATAPRIAFTLSTDDGSIVITSANNWLFNIPQQTLTIPRPKPDPTNLYYYSCQTTDANGNVMTPFAGKFVVNLYPTR